MPILGLHANVAEEQEIAKTWLQIQAIPTQQYCAHLHARMPGYVGLCVLYTLYRHIDT